ncbi:MAG: response regulator [bacterium]|nr:response regulator [bacterium]
MNKKILLVEDDDFIRDMYVEEFTRSGFTVSAFNTGEKGLEAMKAELFDLVVLDIMLPGINGLEVLKLIKQDPTFKSLKVILLTNLGQETIIQQGFKLGAIGYLIKSAYNPDQIVNEIRGFIEDKPADHTTAKKPELTRKTS